MNNNIQCSIESSTTKIELNSAVDGVFLVPELEGLAGLPEIRTTSGVNAGYDGGWTSAQNYDARLISIRGVIANPDISKVEDKRRAIASLLGQGRKEQLTLRFTTEAGNAYAISVRTISCEMALQRVLTTQEFLIQLRADDPLIYDDGTTGGIAAILQPQRALGGFEINFGLPLAIGGGAEDTVVDNGNETVYPVIKLYGALHSPTVVNRTTNQQMQILADLQYSIDWHTYRSATGDYILVNDGLNGAPMTLSQLLGNAEQTTYSGKNLLPPTADWTQTINGVTIKVEGGVYTFSGTSTSGGTSDTWKAVIAPYTIQAGDYYHVGNDFINSQIQINIYFTDGTMQNASFNTLNRIYDLSPHAGKTISQLRIYWNAGNTFNGVAKPMILHNVSTVSDYEPYVGGTPAPNPQSPMPISTVTGEQTVQVTGRNLVEDTISGSSIDGNGIIRSNSDFDTQVAFVIEGETYTLSYTGETVVGGYFATKPTMNSVSIDGTRIVNNNKTFVAQYTGYFTFRTNAGETNAQCERGSTATTYEPYQSQSYYVNLGKNLLPPTEDWAQTINDVSINYNGGIFTFSGTATANTSTTPRAATAQYTIRDGDYLHYNNSFASVQINIQFFFTDGTNYATSMSVVNRVVALNSCVGKTISSYRLNFNSGNAFNGTVKPMIVHNVSTPTSFAPYFTPIELAKVGSYRDRIYKNGGKWYIEKQVGKVVLDGTEYWALAATYTNCVRFVDNDFIVPFTTSPLLCDYFTQGVGGTDAQNIAVHGQQRAVMLTILKTIASTMDEFKAWLASTNPSVYYPLATPTTTEITDETLRAQLNFLASLYEGENNISLMGTGAQGEMVISYATGYTVNQDVITIDSQARTITLNGQDVYHLKTSESEFLVLAPGENKLYLTSEVSDDSGYAEVKFKQGYLSI